MRVLIPLVLLTACAPRPECCKTADCSDGAEQTSGSEVIRFRGEVPRNLLILSIDTLRKDHLGVYGSDGGHTPFLDQLASEGVVVRDHVQCSNWTFGSMTCTMAGQSNPSRGHFPLAGGDEVPKDSEFLATWMTEAGFDTSVFTVNNYFSNAKGNTQGYQQHKRKLEIPADQAILEAAKRARRQSVGGKRPWFLHIHVMDPHLPYDPEPQHRLDTSDLEPWPDSVEGRARSYFYNAWKEHTAPEERALLTEHTLRAYAGEVRTTDARIEDAWAQLDADCMLDDTLVVVFNDHGEAAWEHGYFDHGKTNNAEVNDGILFFWAKNIEPGEWTQTTSALDLVPTLLDLYGLDVPKQVEGMPIGTAPTDRPVFAAGAGDGAPVQSVILNGKKLQYYWETGRTGTWDRSADPLETTALHDPALDAALWELLEPRVHLLERALPAAKSEERVEPVF